MRNIILLLSLAVLSCKSSEPAESPVAAIADNPELKVLYQQDLADRQTGEINWPVVTKNDKQRETRVYELLDSSLVRTSRDYANAAMIFQHGTDTVASGMAVKMMRKAVELDPTTNKWLFAAAIDRDLMRKGEPQIYGTQYIKMGDEPTKLYTIDTTQVSDAERVAYGVETLTQQREKVTLLNKKSLSELLASGKSVDDIVAFVRQEDRSASNYNISESGINNLGYELMAKGGLEDALKVFQLNTELYPEAYNAHDSLGESLLKLGRKEEAIVAYRKSLQLNPENKNAAAVLVELENK